MKRRIPSALLARSMPLALVLACSSPSKPSGPDTDKDNVADDLGRTVDGNGDGYADSIDINGDGSVDGPGIDSDGDGSVDALALDTDCDGFYDSMDTTGDGLADFVTSRSTTAVGVPGCTSGLASGGAGGSSGSGGSSGGGSAGSGGSGGSVPSALGDALYQGTGSSTDRYAEGDVYRNGVGYKFIANGWGSGWQSHQISWNGTSFDILSLNGSQGANYSPAGYPTVFCGNYSMKQSIGACGLPAEIGSLSSVMTGWRWKANGNTGQYNAAWDIWIGNGTSLSSYLMVWLRDPPDQQPAGSATSAGATVAGLPGSWSIWSGNVEGRPIVNYVRAEGTDLAELEFDVMAVYQDALQRNLSLPGTHLMAVAIGFEIWNGPIGNLQTEDFYVDVK
jgi:hypothetical protein